MSEQLFKGYVQTKNKKCIERFKDRTDFCNYEQIKNLPEFAGILNDNTILIDIDETEPSDILFQIVKDMKLKCRVYQTTRGKHVLFKNKGVTSNKTHVSLAVGLTADIKLGSRNSYSILKFNGRERTILYDTPEEEIEELPKWLLPIKTNTDFINMETGDGRNQALFNYELTLQSNDFTIEEGKECIKIINKYILKDPLSEIELETVLRTDAWQKPIFFKGTAFLFDKFATYLKNANNIVKIDSKLHIYVDGTYLYRLDLIEKEMIKTIPNLNRSKRTEVISYLNIICEEKQQQDANLIAFRNGVYNVIDDSFNEFSPEFVITNKINWDYNNNAYSELADKTLNKISCNDPDMRMLLEEMIGYTFYRRNEIGKVFILIGDKSNGKSTFIAILRKILGDINISSLDLKNFNDRFAKATLYKKLANLGDDIGEDFIADPALFKKIATGDRIQAEEKGQPPFEFDPYCKLIFSANVVPRIKDKTGAVLRRLIIVPFDAKFTDKDNDFDPNIKYKLQAQQSMEYLILLGIKGLKRVLTTKKFSMSSRVEKKLDEYEETNNPVLAFIKECEIEDRQIENEPTQDVYRKYQEYCLRNGYTPLAHNEFSKQVLRLMNFETVRRTISGKKYTIFIDSKK